MKRNDLTGLRFGNWQVLKPGQKPSHWLCKCACEAGTVQEVLPSNLKRGPNPGCLACRHLRHELRPKLKLEGKVFDQWTVLRRAERASYWVCQCACGTTDEVFGPSLMDGKSKGCRECWSTRHFHLRFSGTKHGLHKSLEYGSWRRMLDRCYRTEHESYPHYGGRGIRVCRRWRRSFSAFYKDMGPKPTPRHTIDRTDVNGDYAPENCRWASPRQQARNRRGARRVEFRGKTMHLKRAVKLSKTSLKYATVAARIDRGWDVEKALTTPARAMKK